MCAQRVQLKTTIGGQQVPLNPYTDCVKNVRQQMPLAGSKLLGTTVLYVGPATDTYSTGVCYTCKATESSSYYWEAVAGGGEYTLTKEAVDGVIGASTAGSNAKFYNEQGAFTEVDMSGYLPLSGGTITGDLNITGSSVNIDLNSGTDGTLGSFSVYVPRGLDEDFGTPLYHSIQMASDKIYAIFKSTTGWQFKVIDSNTNSTTSYIYNYHTQIRIHNQNVVALVAGEDNEIMVSLQSADRYKRVAIKAPNGAVINDIPIATVNDISTHATVTASSDALGHIKVDNETITVDENGVATSHAVGHNIFDIFYSMSSKAPAGAMDLSLGTLIASCDTVFPDFWSECLQRKGNAHMFPQFSGDVYYYWSGDNVLGGEGITGAGNAVCYYNGKIYVLASIQCDGDATPPPQSSLWRQFAVPTEQWAEWRQYSVGDIVLYNGQIWCARPYYGGPWEGVGIAPGSQTAFPYSWALYDLPTQIVAPSIRVLTEEEWQAEATANGSCGAFVVDEEAKSVRLPKITSMIQPGDVGVFTEAGLPNISGSFDVRKGATNASTNLALTFKGSLYTSSSSTTAPTIAYAVTSVDSYTPQTINIDASRSSSIYGNSTTVQPPAVGAKLYIQVFTSAVPASMAQAGEFINMLEAKADKTELDAYLPLSGGTMTGDVFWNAETGFGVRHNGDNVDVGWSYGERNGSGIGFRGVDYTSNPGGFCIFARNATTSCQLDCKADGTLNWTGGIVTGTGATDGLKLYSGANNFDGATLQLFKRNHGTYAGRFYLIASTKSSSSDTTSGVEACALIGNPDGTLTWGGKPIVPVYASSITATGGYIKFANKVLIQWGYATFSGAISAKTVTFKTAFANTTYAFLRTNGGQTTQASAAYANSGEKNVARTTTSATIQLGASASSYSWIAIGTW